MYAQNQQQYVHNFVIERFILKVCNSKYNKLNMQYFFNQK